MIRRGILPCWVRSACLFTLATARQGSHGINVFQAQCMNVWSALLWHNAWIWHQHYLGIKFQCVISHFSDMVHYCLHFSLFLCCCFLLFFGCCCFVFFFVCTTCYLYITQWKTDTDERDLTRVCLIWLVVVHLIWQFFCFSMTYHPLQTKAKSGWFCLSQDFVWLEVMKVVSSAVDLIFDRYFFYDEK